MQRETKGLCCACGPAMSQQDDAAAGNNRHSFQFIGLPRTCGEPAGRCSKTGHARVRGGRWWRARPTRLEGLNAHGGGRDAFDPRALCGRMGSPCPGACQAPAGRLGPPHLRGTSAAKPCAPSSWTPGGPGAGGLAIRAGRWTRAGCPVSARLPRVWTGSFLPCPPWRDTHWPVATARGFAA